MFRISGSETFLNFFIHFLITDYILEVFLKIYFLEKLDISFASIFTYCIKNYYTNSIIAILMHYKKKESNSLHSNKELLFWPYAGIVHIQ